MIVARGPKDLDLRISHPARRVLTFIVLYIAFTTLLADIINKIDQAIVVTATPGIM